MNSNLNSQYTLKVLKTLKKKPPKNNKEYKYSMSDNTARNAPPSMKSIVLEKQIRPDYKGSDIKKFLSYINDTIRIPDNLRIVCHSHIMQDFLKTKIDRDIVEKNNLKLKDIFDENLWTILMKINDDPNLPKYISISRHGFSIANLIKSREETTFFTSLLKKEQQLTEIDAKLSIYGILTALLNGSDLVKKEKKNGMKSPPNEIFVSVLIRTWMTAICLYLPHCMTHNGNQVGGDLFSSKSPKNNNSEVLKQKDQKKINFKLIVSPFLKENGKTFDNQPEDIYIQLDNIKKFLEFLIKIKDIGLSDEIKTNLQNISKFFEKKNSLIIYYENKKYTFSMNDKNEIILNYEPKKMEFYTYKTTNPPKNRIQFNSLYIENIKIFHGIEKPEKSKIKEYSRWCEPFSKKNSIRFTTKNKTCVI